MSYTIDNSQNSGCPPYVNERGNDLIQYECDLYFINNSKLMTTKLIKGKDNSSYSLLLLYPIGLKGVSDHFSRSEATEYFVVKSHISRRLHTLTHTYTPTEHWTAMVKCTGFRSR